jgi:TPP-dependent 2-oxoacid decarboxylase
MKDKAAGNDGKQRTPIKDTTTVARLLVRCLENEGVKYVFGIPGEENIHFMDALKGSSS